MIGCTILFFVLFILYSRQIYRYSSLVSGWDGLIQSLGHSEELLQATWNCDENAVANGMPPSTMKNPPCDQGKGICGLGERVYRRDSVSRSELFERNEGA